MSFQNFVIYRRNKQISKIIKYTNNNKIPITTLFLFDEGPMLEMLDYTIHIGSTPTFLYFDLYLYSAYAAHYVLRKTFSICWEMVENVLADKSRPLIYQYVAHTFIATFAL